MSPTQTLQVTSMASAFQGGSLRWAAGRGRAISSMAQKPHRKFFDKIMLREGQLQSCEEGVRFISACREFEDDPVDLLYRLTSHKASGTWIWREEDCRGNIRHVRMHEAGDRQLRAALAFASEDPGFVPKHLLPLLALLGSPTLCRGACKPLLYNLLGSVYRVPGLIHAVQQVLQSHTIPSSDAGPLGWFFLMVASSNPDVRCDPDWANLVEPLLKLGGPAATAAQQLEVVLAGAAVGMGQGSHNVTLAVEDLHTQGGRHDNDDPDFRTIKILPTTAEVGSGVCERHM
eukprot:91965-Pelagomonas_calceolata.AAC.3